MELKKRSFNICVICSLICFCVYGFFQFDFSFVALVEETFTVKGYKIVETVKDISMGLVTGFVATGVVFLLEYHVEKRNATKAYVIASRKLINEIYEMPVFYTNEPRELVALYLDECRRNRKNLELQQSLMNAMGIAQDNEIPELIYEEDEAISYEAKNNLQNWICENLDENTKQLLEEENFKTKFLNEELEKIEKKYVEKIEHFVKDISVFEKISLFEVEQTYGNLCFFRKKYFKANIKEKVHKVQRDFVYDLKYKIDAIKTAYHYDFYIQIFRTIKELEDELYYVEVKEGSPFSIVYKKYCYEMDKSINEMYKKIDNKYDGTIQLQNYKALSLVERISKDWFVEMKQAEED